MDTQQRSSSLADEISVTPESMVALMDFGHAFYQQGKLSEARDVFEGIVLLDSSNPYAHAILGSIHQQQNQFEPAIECFSRALKLHSTDINTLTNRGECYLHLGRLEEAAQDLKAAILLDVEEKNLAANRARFLATVTIEALNLAEEGGPQAVLDAKRRLDAQLHKP
jgi:Flp pilus assembly protein TadD